MSLGDCLGDYFSELYFFLDLVKGDGFVVIDILFEALFEYFVFLSEFGEFVRWFAVAVLVVFRTDSDMECLFWVILIFIVLFFI